MTIKVTLNKIFSMTSHVINKSCLRVILFFSILIGLSELAIMSIGVALVNLTHSSYSSLSSYSLGTILVRPDLLIPLILAFSFLRIYCIKNLISFCHISGYLLGKELMERRLSDASYFEQRTADDNKFLTSLVNHCQVYVSCLQTVSLGVSSCFALLSITFVLLSQSPGIVFLSIISITVFYIIIVKSSSSRLSEVSRQIVLRQKELLTYTTESLALDKENYISNNTNFFINRASNSQHELMRSLSYSSFISSLPKITIEAILFIALAIIVLANNDPSSDIGSQLILVMLAAIRLVPYAQNIYASQTTLRMFKDSIDNLNDYLSPHSYSSNDYNSKSALIKDNLRFIGRRVGINFTCSENKHGSNLFDLTLPSSFVLGSLNHIISADCNTLAIQNHDFVVITGPSGIGKSTLFRSLVGLNDNIECIYKICATESSFKGSLLKDSIFKISYLQQDSHFISDTILSNVRMGDDSISVNDVKNIILSLRLPCNEETLNEYLTKPIGENSPNTLSGGELKRISLARALVRQPDILFCDEITSGLDEDTELEIISLIQKYAKVTFIVSHSANVLAQATKTINLKHL